MEEVLKQLIRKTKVECEESHRKFVAACNALAALAILKCACLPAPMSSSNTFDQLLFVCRNDVPEAVSFYREILRSISEHESRVRTDDLQHLHAVHNLHELLLQKPSGTCVCKKNYIPLI